MLWSTYGKWSGLKNLQIFWAMSCAWSCQIVRVQTSTVTLQPKKKLHCTTWKKYTPKYSLFNWKCCCNVAPHNMNLELVFIVLLEYNSRYIVKFQLPRYFFNCCAMGSILINWVRSQVIYWFGHKKFIIHIFVKLFRFSITLILSKYCSSIPHAINLRI